MTTRSIHYWQLPSRTLELGKRTLIMGVLNVTPDSFSDGGMYFDPARAVDRALQMEAEGADLIDIGGESTRPPHAEILPAAEELQRVLPVLEKLNGRLRIPLSIDTYKANVAQQVIEAGVEIVNDIGGLRFDPAMLPLLARKKTGLVLMHSRGTPEALHQPPPLKHILRSVVASLGKSVQQAIAAGVGRDRIIIDPGLGFGKQFEDNLILLKKLDTMAAIRLPVLVGASRKSFIGKVLDLPPESRLAGSLACVALAIWQGAHVVRVHDVKESLQVARLCDAVVNAGK